MQAVILSLGQGDADRVNAARRGDREDVKRDVGGMLGGLGDLIGGDR
ncbi:MAG: hypothetical protein ACRD09_04980 [Vicinamibacterales bacterium]